MAKTISPVCKLCRREGEKLYLKGERCFTPKCSFEKRSFAPGQHGRTAGRGGGRGASAPANPTSLGSCGPSRKRVASMASSNASSVATTRPPLGAAA